MTNTADSFSFHISLPCEDVIKTKDFYVKELGFNLGREAHNWVDVNFFGNQITFAQSNSGTIATQHYSLDNKRLPIFHIGVILDRPNWKFLHEKFRLKRFFEIEPSVFLTDKVGEHDSFFIIDPNGYYIEFKTFNNLKEIFQK